MMTTDLTRQFATGVAAFFITALLILANAPADRTETGLQLQLQRPAIAAQLQSAASDANG